MIQVRVAPLFGIAWVLLAPLGLCLVEQRPTKGVPCVLLIAAPLEPSGIVFSSVVLGALSFALARSTLESVMFEHYGIGGVDLAPVAQTHGGCVCHFGTWSS